MSQQYKLYENRDGTFTLQGVDLGYGDPRIVAENSKFLIGHIPGHTYASGQTRNYAKPHLTVYEKIGEWEYITGAIAIRRITVNSLFGVIELDIGRGWQKEARDERLRDINKYLNAGAKK